MGVMSAIIVINARTAQSVKEPGNSVCKKEKSFRSKNNTINCVCTKSSTLNMCFRWKLKCHFCVHWETTRKLLNNY